MSRATEEWVGKTDDTPIPPRVRLRVFEAHQGVCHISGRKIRAGEPWDCDHVVALINGGENRETNLAPALRDKHREKTAEDVALKAKVYAKRAKHLGVKAAKRKWPSRGVGGGPSKKSLRAAAAHQAGLGGYEADEGGVVDQSTPASTLSGGGT